MATNKIGRVIDRDQLNGDPLSCKRPLWISRQVLREFIATRTRPQTFAQSSTPEVVIERVRYLEACFQVADDTAAVTRQPIKLLGDFKIGGKQAHDANIVP